MTATTTKWFLAQCQDCTPVRNTPFWAAEDRDEWAAAHEAATGHRVRRGFQISWSLNGLEV